MRMYSRVLQNEPATIVFLLKSCQIFNMIYDLCVTNSRSTGSSLLQQLALTFLNTHIETWWISTQDGTL